MDLIKEHYGNGTETNYTYDEDRRWLDSINTVNGYGEEYQNISYDFDSVGNILQSANITDGYKATQNYTYDSLYQLTKATGQFSYKPDIATDYTNNYSQTFDFNEIGNMTSKYSTQVISPRQPAAMDLNYNLDYAYYEGRAHQAERIDDIFYRYDGNGNVVEERQGGLSDDDDWTYIHPGRGRARALGHNEKAVPYGIGLKKKNDTGNAEYHRVYYWDEENRLKRSEDATNTVEYIYGADGQRTSKYKKHSETLYFDPMWMLSTDHPTFRQSKHIYLGETRIATRMKIEGDDTHGYETVNTYFYHSDHLGSANIITDYEGGVYEHIEYTPYGELWEEQKSDVFDRIPFRFTAKELDDETGNYYYGARYLNPRTSRWISSDPAGLDLINPMDEEGKPRQSFSIIESMNWYSYVSNNPIKYVDPTGMAGQKEKQYSHPINYMSLFEDAPYRSNSGRLTNPDSVSQYFSAKIKPKGLELFAKLLPTGIGDSPQDATLGFLANLTNPDTYVNVRLDVETDKKRENILNWSISITIPVADSEDESRTLTWQGGPLENKDDALNMLLTEPDLMYQIFDDTKVED